MSLYKEIALKDIDGKLPTSKLGHNLKPWGWEYWIELNVIYCRKILHVNKGQRLSKQFHRYKKEIMTVIRGVGLLYLEEGSCFLIDNQRVAGRILKEWIIIKPGDQVLIRPNSIHRLKGLTELEIEEVSTPEVEDLVRLEDDFKRKNDESGANNV